MAVTKSGLFCKTFIDVLDTTQLLLDLDLETHKGALFTDTITPSFTNDTAYAAAPYDANEVVSGGAEWPAGGVVLITTVFTEAVVGSAVFDAADVSAAATTLTSAMCYMLYADALGTNNCICLVDFVTAVSTVAGTFEILWTAAASGGIFNIDLTP